MVNGGMAEIPATNALFGDPVVNVVKHLVIEYKIGGKPHKLVAGENESIELAHPSTGGNAPKSYAIAKGSGGTLEFTAWKPGVYSGIAANGKHVGASVLWSPDTVNLSEGWKVSFAPNLGAPATAKFDHLISWPQHSNPGIKYFSGSATYAKDFNLPASFAATGKAVRLNLGEVKNFATVSVNGKQVAVLWKPPFALDLSGLVHKGVNHLEIKVTNLWPNRIIGDEQLPPDVVWDGGHLKRWPDWLVQGKPRPKTGRITFATWHYYDKNSPLLESGLLGPVTIQATKKVKVRL